MEKITLYKNNRIDQEYELTPDELKAKFREWLKEQDPDWVKYYYSQLENIFVGQGLESVADDPEGKIKALLREVKYQELNKDGNSKST